MIASSFAAALRAHGLHCRVEVRERLALLTPDDANATQVVVRLREVILDEGRRHGFTHVALDVPAMRDGADLPRD